MADTIEDLIVWARSIGAQEFGVYIVIKGSRIVIPLSLTEADLPAPQTGPTPRHAGPRPGSPTDPGG